LRAADSRRFTIVALFCTIPFLLAATVFFFRAAPRLRPIFHEHLWSLVVFLLLLLLLVPAHELIHVIAYRCRFRSRQLWVGIWPERAMAYVLYDAPLPRQRVLGMLAAPFLVLTVLPLAVTPFLSGPWSQCAAFLALLHAALCVGDAATIQRLLRQVPAEAQIHNHGWQLYWATPPA
jgi:hypothetical protein